MGEEIVSSKLLPPEPTKKDTKNPLPGLLARRGFRYAAYQLL
jgi:hypothetical protein